jgi:Flp pilus assembly protein protease CpaA
MLNIFYLRIIILLVFTSIAAYTDYKTGYIYEWNSYSLIILGLILNFIVFPFSTNLNIIFIALFIFLFGYIVYYFGKIGGGDIKLFIGIHLILPYYYNQLFILFVLISSSLLCVIIVSIRYLITIFKKIKLNKNLFLKKRKEILKSFLLLIFFIFLLHYSILTSDLPNMLYLAIIPIFLGLITTIFEEEIREYIYLVNKDIKDLEIGDVLAIDKLSKTKLNKLNIGNRQVLEEKDIKRFKKMKLKKLPIYYNLPKFAPYILLGVIFSLFIFIIL